jgi:hypothetical protein
MTTHIYPRKIFPDNTVLAYDYDVDAAVKTGNELLFHYKSGIMTIPNSKIVEKATLDPTVYESQYSGKNKSYKCYYFYWEPDKDDNTGENPTVKAPQQAGEVGDDRRPQQSRLF